MFMKVDLNQAREICNIVRKNFPYESPWIQYKIEFRNLMKSSRGKDISRDVIELNSKIAKNRKKLDETRDDYQFFTNFPLKYFKKLVNSIHQHKVQNCAETARLGYLVSRINGVKDQDVEVASLASRTIYSEEDKDSLVPIIDKLFTPLLNFEYGSDLNTIDHVVTKIKGQGRQTLVIDPLLNKVDTTKNAKIFYKTEYGDIFNLEDNEEIRITTYPSPPYPAIPRINNDEAKFLGREFPELILDENKNKFLNNGKYFFNF